jgi:hypothetical protein
LRGNAMRRRCSLVLLLALLLLLFAAIYLRRRVIQHGRTQNVATKQLEMTGSLDCEEQGLATRLHLNCVQRLNTRPAADPPSTSINWRTEPYFDMYDMQAGLWNQKLLVRSTFPAK